MPHATHAYPFEGKVWQFAGELSARFSAGPTPRPFLLTLDTAGDVLSLLFDDGTSGWRERTRDPERPGAPHLFYDPLEDGCEYVWLSWHGVGQAVMERLTGQRFTAEDFEPLPWLAERAARHSPGGRFPASWGVMF